MSTVHVGPGGVPGYDHVQELARYLVDVRNQYSLSQEHVEAIRVRWFALNLEDKKKVEYQPRFKDHLTQGRFKTSKKSSTTAGLDSVWRKIPLVDVHQSIRNPTLSLIEASVHRQSELCLQMYVGRQHWPGHVARRQSSRRGDLRDALQNSSISKEVWQSRDPPTSP